MLVDPSKSSYQQRDFSLKDDEIDYVDRKLFTVRTENCMRNARLHSLIEIGQTPKSKLTRIPNFGRKSLNEVIEVLDKEGIPHDLTDWESPANTWGDFKFKVKGFNNEFEFRTLTQTLEHVRSELKSGKSLSIETTRK